MSIDLPPVPPAVVEFAEKNGYKQVTPNEFWVASVPENNFNNYSVFNVYNKEMFIKFILLKKDEVRFATEDETKELTNVYY